MVMRNHPGRGLFLYTAGWVLLLLALRPAAARSLRVATYNVEHGIGAPDSAKRAAQTAVLRRVNADIVAFQELTARTSNDWVQLAAELEYPHRAWGERGPFSGHMVVGYWSRYPIVASGSLSCPAGAREFTRRPLRVTVQVAGAAQPLTLWNMHHKALYRPVDDFRRAVEAARIAADITHYLDEHPEWLEYILLGDMNDDEARGAAQQLPPQPTVINAPPAATELPKSFVLGTGLSWPRPYRSFPTDAYRLAGRGLQAVPAFREGTHTASTHYYTNLRLDYLFVSPVLWARSETPPAAEVYHSEFDRDGGLPKAGTPLPAATSRAASDHDIVFVDLRLAPAAAPAAPQP